MIEETGPRTRSPDTTLSSVFEGSAEGIILLDAEDRVIEWSGGATRIYGHSREEALGRPLSMFDSEAATLALMGVAHRGGDLLSLFITPHRARGQDGRTLGMVKIVRNVTDERQRGHLELVDRELSLKNTLGALRRSHDELKTTQLQLIQSAKLESIGRLAASVAHEVKNPLAILLAGIQFLKKSLPDADPGVAETLDDLKEAVHRANGVIGGLLDFAASTELRLEPVNVEDMITASIQLVRHALQRRHMNLEREQRGELPTLPLDRPKIEQVMVNLMINAIDAMPDGGTLTVRSSLAQLTKPGDDVGYRRTDPFRVGETVALIEIEDTGPGIPPHVLGRIFDPSFTTKPPGKGTGLGLAVSKTIIGLHRGSIRIENRPEGGARATLMFRAGETIKESLHDQAPNPAGG